MRLSMTSAELPSIWKTSPIQNSIWVVILIDSVLPDNTCAAIESSIYFDKVTV